MPSNFSAFVGVDAGAGRKPFTFVVLDAGQKLRTVGGGQAVDVLSYLAGLGDALVALSPPWRGGRPIEGQPSSLQLPSIHLSALGLDTQAQLPLPGSEAVPPCPSWMTATCSLLARLRELDCRPFPSEGAARQWFEAPAETGFRSLLGVEPFPAGILEGRIQRQLVLSDLELDVPDAMEFFEEVTRFRLLRSQLPYERILPQPELNAWMAAACASFAVHEPARLRSAGESLYYPVPKD